MMERTAVNKMVVPGDFLMNALRQKEVLLSKWLLVHIFLELRS